MARISKYSNFLPLYSSDLNSHQCPLSDEPEIPAADETNFSSKVFPWNRKIH
jgi:hypothetical protein